MSELKAGVLINYTSIIIRLLTSFFLTPFVIDSLGKEEYGLFVLSSSVIAWLALTDLGLGATLRKYVTGFRARGEEEEQKSFLGQAMLLFSLMACITLTAGIICFFFLDLFFPNLTTEQNETLQVLYLLTLGNMIVAFPLRPITCVPGCYLKYIVPGIIGLTTSLLQAGLTVLLLLWGYKAIALSVLGVTMGVAGLISGLWYTIHVLGVRLRFGKPNWKLYRDMFQFSFWVLLNQLMDLFYWRAGAPIVARLSGAGAVTLFTLGTSFSTYFMTASTAISGVVGTKIMQMVAVDTDKEELTNIMIRTGRLQLAMLLVIMLGFTVLGQDFLTLWVGKTIGEQTLIVWVGALLVLYPLLLPLTQNAGISLLQAMNIHKGRAVILFYSSLICVIIGYILTLLYGVVGMFIGTGVSLFFGQCIMINIYYHRRAGLNIPRFFRETYLPALLPMLIMALAGCGLVACISISSWSDFVIAAVVYGGGCAVLLFALYLNAGEREMFLGPLKKLCRLG